MKTSELIRLLQEEDPSGEGHVVVGNLDIHFVEALPAYYDGSAQELIRDPARAPYYNITGGKYRRSGTKIQIHTLSFSSVIENDPDNSTFDYSELPTDRQESAKQSHDNLRKFVKDVENRLEKENFLKWFKEKASKLTEDLEDVKEIAEAFFDKNLDRNDPIPKDIPTLNESYVSRRHKQWDRQLKVTVDDGYIQIKKLHEVFS